MARFNCVTVLAPAKLNLALDVVGLLPGGYHDLDMTMQAITLYERWCCAAVPIWTCGCRAVWCPQRQKHCHQGSAGLF